MSEILDRINTLGPCLSIMTNEMRYEKYTKYISELDAAYVNKTITFDEYISAKSKLSFYMLEKS